MRLRKRRLKNGRRCLLPASGKIEADACRQEGEAGGGDFAALLAGEQHLELLLQGVEMQDVGRRVGDLRLGQRLGRPVRTLLLLREIDAEQFAGEILEAVAVGVGAGQPRGDLGAEDRPAITPKVA